jgi:prevent-host-death family protein
MRGEFREAKTGFSQLLHAALKNGPQVVMRGGVDVAVLVSLEEWKPLQNTARPTLKELLLGSGALGAKIPKRRTFRRREEVEFE